MRCAPTASARYALRLKMKTGSIFPERLRQSKLAKRLAGAAFLFFLIKGLVWLGIFAAAAWAAWRVS